MFFSLLYFVCDNTRIATKILIMVHPPASRREKQSDRLFAWPWLPQNAKPNALPMSVRSVLFPWKYHLLFRLAPAGPSAQLTTLNFNCCSTRVVVAVTRFGSHSDGQYYTSIARQSENPQLDNRAFLEVMIVGSYQEADNLDSGGFVVPKIAPDFNQTIVLTGAESGFRNAQWQPRLMVTGSHLIQFADADNGGPSKLRNRSITTIDTVTVAAGHASTHSACCSRWRNVTRSVAIPATPLARQSLTSRARPFGVRATIAAKPCARRPPATCAAWRDDTGLRLPHTARCRPARSTDRARSPRPTPPAPASSCSRAAAPAARSPTAARYAPVAPRPDAAGSPAPNHSRSAPRPAPRANALPRSVRRITFSVER